LLVSVATLAERSKMALHSTYPTPPFPRRCVSTIVRGLLDLGRTLELETVAEGVEDDSQLDSWRDETCELAHGCLFARPLEPIDAEALLARIGGVPSVFPH
jgi:EAL domain-containing protein (putative c-di-GMP-specific phosphodiesterase class I)